MPPAQSKEKDMNITRRGFLTSFAAGAVALGGPSCGIVRAAGRLVKSAEGLFESKPRRNAKIAVQLYSIRTYIKRNGLAKALEAVSKIGFRAVEFAGYWGIQAAEIKKMLDGNGLVACGTHVGRNDFSPENYAKTCEFNRAIGNDLLICPGGGNFPDKKSKEPLEDFMKKLVDFYNTAAANCAKLGCSVGLHNHMREFELKLKDGTTYWDYFFTNTDPAVKMEQDVGWTTCAGIDPCEQFRKYPHRSPTIHAKENGMGKGVKKFDAILGEPGQPGAKGVDWDKLIPAVEEDGVKWLVVECEKHEDDLGAIGPSFRFLKAKGF